MADLYSLTSLEFGAIFAGPPPQFGESQRKQAAVLSKTKKGQFTLDSWIKVGTSVVDPNTLNLDPNPGFWPNLDPDPYLGLNYQF